MPFSNQQYLYDHLPARYRREDASTLFLKRFLTWFGETLDGYDEAYDNFADNINPQTASEEWIKWWMLWLFNFSWYPWWFSITDLRTLYGHMAGHLARRGTSAGIVAWLADFGITATVYKRSPAWGKFVYGRTAFSFRTPLRLVVEIQRVTIDSRRMSAWSGTMAYGKGFYSSQRRAFTDAEIENLVRFQQPVGQRIDILWSTREEKRPIGAVAPKWRLIQW